MLTSGSSLDFKKIFAFWIPLAATWLMMAIEGPFLAAIIARLPAPKFNLAAFGVAFSFALLVEAPIIMIMSASTALVNNGQAFLKLRRFTNFLNLTITGIMVIGLVPPVFNFVTQDLIGLPENIARITHLTLILFIPWPSSIGVRRFYQGILIRNNLTRRIAYSTVIRIISMAATALGLYFFTDMEGAYTGAAAASIGVFCEAIACRLMARKSVIKLIGRPIQNNREQLPLTYRFIVKFYLPLAFTSVLALGVHPLVTFFLSKSRFPIESLAVLPVINSLVFIFRSMGLSYQEVVIALVGEKKEGYMVLRNFAFILALTVIAILGLIALTPLARVWFFSISGLSLELTKFSFLPTQILILLPGLSVWISFQRGLLVSLKNTAPIIQATALEVFFIALILFFSIYKLNFIGAVAAACSYIVGRLAANLYLWSFQKKLFRS